jgi:hypothetical protein
VKINVIIATALLGWGLWSLTAGAQTLQGYDWAAGPPDGGTDGATSMTMFMASHRFQRHSVVTSDGAIHIVVNKGINGTMYTGALQIYTSIDNGTTWTKTHEFPGTSTYQTSTGAVSTDDVYLVTATGEGGTQYQYLEVAYDRDAASGDEAGLLYTELLYQSSPSPSWTTITGYPQVVAQSDTTTYQQPAFARDANGDIWLADLELTSTAGLGTGQIMVYERVTGTWSTGITITNPTSYIEHAPRPVYVPSTTTADIGLIFQSDNCLYWVTIKGTTVSSPAQELSSYSNGTENNMQPTCNMPTSQNLWNDTAASVATNPLTGDQYLGFVIQYPSGMSTTAVYALTFEASTATWLTSSGQLLTGNQSPASSVYVKSTLQEVTVGGTATYPNAYMFINDAPGLDFSSSQTLPTVSTTSYAFVDYLDPNPNPTNPTSFSNPRIEAPEYIPYYGALLSTVPVWEQYTSNTSVTPETESLIYWIDVPN